MQRSIKLLGHIVDKDGTRPVGAKVQAIHQFPISTRGDLHTFLGMTGHYSTYCKDYAKISIPLRKVLHGRGPFTLTREHEIAISQLKNILLSEPVLAHPDWDLPFEVHCDASNYAIGVVLCQVIDGKERVIGYYSRLLRDAEKRYDTTQKECLAVVWAVKKLRPYLYGRPFVVKTDHASLKWLLNLKDHKGRLMRWALLLQDYTFVIVHRAGKANANADALSRLIQLSCLDSQSQKKPTDNTATTDNPMDMTAASIVSAVLRSQTKKSSSASNSQQSGLKDHPEGSREAPIVLEPRKTVHLPAISEGDQATTRKSFTLRDKPGSLLTGSIDEYEAVYDKIADSIRREQQADAVLQRILAKFTRETRQDYVTKDGVHYRLKNKLLHLVKVHQTVRGVKNYQELLLVPKRLQREVIRLHHDHPTAGHFGYITRRLRGCNSITHGIIWPRWLGTMWIVVSLVNGTMLRSLTMLCRRDQ